MLKFIAGIITGIIGSLFGAVGLIKRSRRARTLLKSEISSGINRWFYGLPKTRTGPSTTRSSYGRYYQYYQPRVTPRYDRRPYQGLDSDHTDEELGEEQARRRLGHKGVGDLVFDSYEDAATVLRSLSRKASLNGSATVSDLYNLCGVTGSYVDGLWGWYPGHLDQIMIEEVRNDSGTWLFKTPAPVLLRA